MSFNKNWTDQLLVTPFSEDLPRAFNCTDINRHPYYCGAFVQTILNFAVYRNLRLQFDFVDSLAAPEINRRIAEGRYALSMHGAIYMRQASKAVKYSYPLEWMENCIMVPLDDELPKYFYVIWPFGPYIWTTLFIGIFYFSIATRLIDTTRKVTRSITRNMVHSIAIILYCSNMNVNLRNQPFRIYFFYGLLFAQGFILSVYYFTNLTAYNMKPVFLRPIDSVDEVLKRRLPILITNDLLDELRLSKYVDLSQLEPLMQGITRQKFNSILESLNRSFGYVVSQDQWNFMHKQQRNLLQPKFRKSDICFGQVFNAFPMSYAAHSQYYFNLKYFILLVQQSGLWRMWEEQAFNIAVSTGYIKILLDTYPVEPLNLEFFWIAWIVLGVGLPVSGCAMVVEYYLQRSRKWNEYHVIV